MARDQVLVVDDEESMRYFLERSLKRKGFDVAAVSSGEAAVEAAQRRVPVLVLLDLRLPGMDGIETLSKLRAIRPDLKVILMTGFGSVERALEAMRGGAADFITKPFKTAELMVKVDEALGRPAPEEAPSPDVKPPEEPVADGAAAAGRSQAPPPRPLTAFLREAARARGIEVSATDAGDLPLREAARVFEAIYFTELFERTGGNVSLAARISGVSRPSLHRKINDLGLDVDRYRR